MKLRLLLSAILMAAVYCALAQDPVPTAQDTLQSEKDTAWHAGGFFNLSFSQVSLSNWAAGGEDAISGVGLYNLYFNYITRKHTWENTLDLGYGMTKSGNDPVKKFEDKIDFNSKYGRKATGNLYYAAMLNFHSQFRPGYDYYDNDSNVLLSDFFAPAILMISLGLDWKPVDYFSFYFSPLTGKLTFVNNQELADKGTGGVEPLEVDPVTGAITPGENLRAELGASVSLKFKKEVIHNVTIESKLDLFENYTDPVVSNRKNIDVNWTMLISMKINNFLAATLGTDLIYDHNIPVPLYTKDASGEEIQTGTGPRTQFKEVFSLGITYKY